MISMCSISTVRQISNRFYNETIHLTSHTVYRGSMLMYKGGCIDAKATNYGKKAKKDNGERAYEAMGLFWYAGLQPQTVATWAL
jgi:hypothetical protein